MSQSPHFFINLSKCKFNQKMKSVAIARIFKAVAKPYLQEEILDSLWHDLNTCKYCGYNACERGVQSHYRLEHTQEILDEIQKRPISQERSKSISKF